MSNVFDQMIAKENVEEVIESKELENNEDSAKLTYSPQKLKQVSQELLRAGLIESIKKPDLYKYMLGQKARLKTIFEPLDLDIAYDEMRGIAYLIIVKDEDSENAWSHSLVRKKPLTLEQSFLVAILRQHYINYEYEHGLGASKITISIEELLVQINTYFGESGSEMHDHKKLSSLIENLNSYGVISGSSKDDEVRINPIIVHIANHENLTLLLKALQEKLSTEKLGYEEVSDE